MHERKRINPLSFLSALHNNQFALCVVSGGLNDSLCIMEDAFEFAEANSLSLVFDLSEAWIPGPLESVFIFNDPKVLLLSSPRDVRNFELKLRENPCIQIVRVGGRKGGIHSVRIFQRVSITKKTLDDYRLELESLPDNFAAVHIRHSDYQTEYKSVLTRIHRIERRTIFLSTDSREVDEFARQLFGAQLARVDRTRPKSSSPLHKQDVKRNSDEGREMLREAIVDLLILASADVFYYTATFGVGQSYSPVVSGFGRLAKSLLGAPEVLGALIGHPTGTGKKSKLIFTPNQILTLVWRQRYRPVFRYFYRVIFLRGRPRVGETRELGS